MVLSMSKPIYKVSVLKDIYVEMRDGVSLATDVYLPIINGQTSKRLPTILQRTPYNKEDPIRCDEVGEWFASRGYAVVLQDFRGRFRSEGDFYKYADMGVDGYDTTEWIVRQSWSNGKIGTIGTSFMAHFQLALACMNPPNLTTMVVNQGGFTNAYFSSCRHMGALELRMLTWAFTCAANSKEAQANTTIRTSLEAVDITEYLDPMKGPIKHGESPLSQVPNYERFYIDMLTESEYTDYWKKIGLCAEQYIDKIPDMPVLLLGAWYDSYTRTTSDLYRILSENKKGPIKLIFGPWIHGWKTLESRVSGDVDFGSDAPISGSNLATTPNELSLRWFDHWMKDVRNKVDQIPPVHYFLMGGGQGTKTSQGRISHNGKWKISPTWPLSDTKYTRYYLHMNGELTTTPPESILEPTSYMFNPTEPVPTIGGNISSARGVMIPGPFNQVESPDVYGCKPPYIPLADRQDVMVFETPPLKKPIEVTGPISAILYVSSSAPDTDFTLKLIDHYPPNQYYPNGYAMNLSDTIFRARFHSSWQEPELLDPDKVYRLDMISYPTSNLFGAGHKIRVDISSSNYPRFDINPNTGEPLGLSTKITEAINRIYHDSNHPSNIVLPLIHI